MAPPKQTGGATLDLQMLTLDRFHASLACDGIPIPPPQSTGTDILPPATSAMPPATDALTVINLSHNSVCDL